MKRLILMIMLFAGVCFGAQAQTTKGHGHGKELKKLSKDLNLTADQRTKVSAIMKTKTAQLDSLNAKSEQLGKKAAHKQRKQIITTADEQLNGVLNDEQKKTYAALKASRAEKMHNKKKSE